jgi:integrase
MCCVICCASLTHLDPLSGVVMGTMPDELPVRKFIKVWIKKRKNPPKRSGRQTTSLTLEWVEYGQRFFMSLGTGATRAYAEAVAKAKEAELNSPSQIEQIKPLTWDDFSKEYMDRTYPGHELRGKQRKAAARNWEKSDSSRRAESRVLKDFSRIVKPVWCHEVTSKERQSFIAERLPEVGSPQSVNADLRMLRHLFNVLEDWKHVPKGSNPFAGRGQGTIGSRRSREKDRQRTTAPKYYTRSQVVSLLDRVDRELSDSPDDWMAARIRALVYFEAYTGVRIEEALFLEWSDIEWEVGVANVIFKIEHGLKTEGSENPIGLSEELIAVLHDWQNHRTCNWVFPNKRNRPWTGGSKGDKPLDHLKALARRAGIDHANWKMFRHTLTTHGKQWFGLTEEQVRAQLRHTTTETQKNYTHSDKENLHELVKRLDFRRDG